jgi:hypothetical protein
LLRKSKVTVAHGLLVTRSIMACHIHHQERAARAKAGRNGAEHRGGVVNVMKDQHDDADIGFACGEWWRK